MTHPGILKINELFNSKLSKEISNIRSSVDYQANFGNAKLFKAIKEELTKVGYNDISGQLDTLFCIIDSIKSRFIQVQDIQNPEVRTIFSAFRKLISFGKISFDDRVRRDLLMCIYLDKEHVNFKTNFLKLEHHKEIFNEFISILANKGLIIIDKILYKIDSADLFQQVYNNAKSVITNMNSRGMSTFAIACYFWIKNRDFLPKPFLQNWSNLNFMKAVISTIAFETSANEEIKEKILEADKRFTFWTVLSEQSLMTGKVENVDKNRKELNQIINQVLNAEGEEFIREYLRKVKLIQASTAIAGEINNPKKWLSNFYKELEQAIRNELREKTTEVPTKELIIEAIKYQFMISRIIGIDFSSKRKDHLVLDKNTKQRVFEL